MGKLMQLKGKKLINTIYKTHFITGCFVYFFFGSVKDLTIGPTAILSLLTYTVVQNLNADLAVLSTFLSGCMIFLFGVLNLGFLMQFISTPTIVGFMNGATVTIAVGQIRRLLGIRSGKSSEFVDSLDTLYHYYDETTFADATLGISSLILLVVVRHIGRKYPKSIFLRYLSISRNAIIVFGGILIAYLYHLKDEKPFLLTGTISSGFPSIKLPPFSTVHDETDYDFSGMIKALGLSLLTIPIISIVESVAIAKSFNKGKVVDVTQEMLALGLCNIASSFFSSIPITGSFTRSAVNHASGVKTQMGGIFTGIAVLAVLGFLTKTFYFIPKTCLAAVIIAAMFTMMEVRKVFQIYKTRKLDIVPFLGTFLVSLWKGLELGILVGVGINIMFVLYESSRPKLNLINKKIDETEIIYVSPSRNIVYSSAEYFKTKIFEASLREEKIHHIVVDGERIDALDSTSVMVSCIIVNFAQLKCNALFHRTSQAWLRI